MLTQPELGYVYFVLFRKSDVQSTGERIETFDLKDVIALFRQLRPSLHVFQVTVVHKIPHENPMCVSNPGLSRIYNLFVANLSVYIEADRGLIEGDFGEPHRSYLEDSTLSRTEGEPPIQFTYYDGTHFLCPHHSTIAADEVDAILEKWLRMEQAIEDGRFVWTTEDPTTDCEDAEG